MAQPKPSGGFLPMPLGPLLNCPALIAAPGAVYRAVMCLAITYWLAGCRDLPPDPTQLAALIRLPNGHYNGIKSAVKAATDELFPVLKAEYDARHKSRENVRASALHAASFSPNHAKRRAKSISDKRIHPVTKPKYQGDGRTDLHARQASIDREQAAQDAQKPRESPFKIPSRAPHQKPPPPKPDPSRVGMLREGPSPVRK
jgi:hypothetical protein